MPENKEKSSGKFWILKREVFQIFEATRVNSRKLCETGNASHSATNLWLKGPLTHGLENLATLQKKLDREGGKA